MYVLFLSLLLTCFQTGNPGSTLVVDMTNVKSKGGTIRLALFRESQRFLDDKPFLTKVVNDNINQITIPVEPGSYAIAVYHDLNNNGELDKKMFGIPKEPYGFSNNFRPVMSAPKFNDCKLQVDKGEKRISIKLI